MALLLLRLQELVRPDLQGVDRRVLVRLCLLLFGFKLCELATGEARHRFGLFDKLLLELLQFNLVLAEQGPLVHVFIDPGLVLDLLGPRRKLECLVGLIVAIRRW